jgi:hypothetical protein
MILRDDFTWGIYWELFKLSLAGPQALSPKTPKPQYLEYYNLLIIKMI